MHDERNRQIRTVASPELAPAPLVGLIRSEPDRSPARLPLLHSQEVKIGDAV